MSRRAVLGTCSLVTTANIIFDEVSRSRSHQPGERGRWHSDNDCGDNGELAISDWPNPARTRVFYDPERGDRQGISHNPHPSAPGRNCFILNRGTPALYLNRPSRTDWSFVWIIQTDCSTCAHQV